MEDRKTDLQPWQPSPDQSKDDIITWLYGRKDLKVIIKKIAKTSYLIEELTSELFLWLSSKPEVEIIDLYQRELIDYSILEWINRQWKSNTSPFYNKIRKFEIGKAMTEEQQAKVIIALYSDNDTEMQHVYAEALHDAIENLRSPGEYIYYHRDIIKSYLELKTIKAVSEKVKIRSEYVSQAITDAKLMLREMISKEVNDFLNNQISEY